MQMQGRLRAESDSEVRQLFMGSQLIIRRGATTIWMAGQPEKIQPLRTLP